MFKSSLEAELHDNGEIIYTNKGDSMFPLIRSKGDLLLIKKYNGHLKKYDIPLYKRCDGKYILHRVLSIKRDGSYVMCGDNRYSKEYGITDNNILGVLHSVIRNGKTLKMTDFKCRVYTHLWCDFFVIRKLILVFVKVIKKTF